MKKITADGTGAASQVTAAWRIIGLVGHVASECRHCRTKKGVFNDGLRETDPLKTTPRDAASRRPQIVGLDMCRIRPAAPCQLLRRDQRAMLWVSFRHSARVAGHVVDRAIRLFPDWE